jgi:ACR3 family arsenite transporter
VWNNNDRIIVEEPPNQNTDKTPLRMLSFLDRFLVVWIFISMAIGILLGNLDPSAGQALRKGNFVGVSIPIGRALTFPNNSKTSVLIVYL